MTWKGSGINKWYGTSCNDNWGPFVIVIEGSPTYRDRDPVRIVSLNAREQNQDQKTLQEILLSCLFGGAPDL